MSGSVSRLGRPLRQHEAVVIGGLAVLLAGFFVGILSARAEGDQGRAPLSSTPLTEGEFQYPAWIDPATGEVIDDLVPDFLPIWDRTATSIVGVVSRDDILPRFDAMAGEPFGVPGMEEPWPVFDSEGGTLIGHVFDGVGFVSLEEQDRGFVPEPSTATTVIDSSGTP